MHGAPINVNGSPAAKHCDWGQEAKGVVRPLILFAPEQLAGT